MAVAGAAGDATTTLSRLYGGGGDFDPTLLWYDAGAEQARRFVGGAYVGPRAGSAGVAVAGAAGDATTTWSRLYGGGVDFDSTPGSTTSAWARPSDHPLQTTSPAYK